MKANDETGITFANLVLGQGMFNGVVHVTLGACLYTPVGEALDKVEMDPVITARLRMDIPCARLLHKTLGDILDRIDAPRSAAAGIAPASEEHTRSETETIN